MEFHGHLGKKLIYKHPLIQYKVFKGSALIIGLKEGAYLLKAMPELEYLEIYFRKFPIIQQNKRSVIVPFGITNNMICYDFLTPWIGLNKNNYNRYRILKDDGQDSSVLLEKILVGNILSMCNSVWYTVNDKVYIKTRLEEVEVVEIKDVMLTSFKGEFETNFFIPDLWGIGSKVSLGYVTIMKNSGGYSIWYL